MGRRGSFPVSPGLEEYIHNLRHDVLHTVELEQAQQRAEDRRDTSTAFAKVSCVCVFVYLCFIWSVVVAC